jgi:threonine/homoserine/homoserine lactone efflux protein
LSVLTGPIFFTILQVSIEKGAREGIFLVAGQWLSDFMYIGLSFAAAEKIRELEQNEALKDQISWYLGSTGSIFLIILGVVLILTKSANKKSEKISQQSSAGFFLQGFLLNTLTPFPLFFWMSLMSASVGRELDNVSCLLLFLGIMTMVVLTDILKVFSAQKISKGLNAFYVLMVRRIAGLALILSGIYMFVRIVFM